VGRSRYCADHLSALLLVNVALNGSGCDRSGSTNIITARPHIRQPAFEMGELISQQKSGVTFQLVHHLMRRKYAAQVWAEKSKTGGRGQLES
jgi:hypothetical protein